MLVDAKVPHVGFNTIEVVNTNKIIKGLEKAEFYFMHSYEVVNYKYCSLTEYVVTSLYHQYKKIILLCSFILKK